MEEGFCKGDVCNRNGCVGIIEEHEIDGCCSCHINPPCSYCTEPKGFCPICGWDDKEEQSLIKVVPYTDKQIEGFKNDIRLYEERRSLFFKKYRGEIPTDKFECRKESHTHFSMRVYGVFPKGFDLKTIMDEIKGTFGGRFNFIGDTSFEYIAYTD